MNDSSKVLDLIQFIKLNEDDALLITEDDYFHRHLNHDHKRLVSQTEIEVYIPKYFKVRDETFVRYYNERTNELIEPCKECINLPNDRRCPNCLILKHKSMLKKKRKNK